MSGVDVSNVVVAPEWVLRVSAEDIASPAAASRFFECGHCSDAKTRVYHNIIGRHRHIPAAEARAEIWADFADMFLRLKELSHGKH